MGKFKSRENTGGENEVWNVMNRKESRWELLKARGFRDARIDKRRDNTTGYYAAHHCL